MRSPNTDKKNSLRETTYDDIRPFNDSEVKKAIDSLLRDEQFKKTVESIILPISWTDFSAGMRNYETISDFQENVIYTLISKFIQKNIDKLELTNPANVDISQSNTYISNHRDIILDAALFNILLHEKGYQTTEVAIGDNLLIYPWITTLMKLNRCFIVKRGVSIRQVIIESKHLSNYIHQRVTADNQSVWIAQREGRAKDSNDRTQTSLLKMLSLVNSKNPIEPLKALNMVPLSVSYEYDPCDYLKAKEYQLKRDFSDYKKSNEDDLENMLTGIVGYKGRVCFKLGKPLNEKIDSITDTHNRTTILQEVANLIDEEIFRNYEFYPHNYVAYDLIKDADKFTDKYTAEEKETFIAYVDKQIDKIDIQNKDTDFLKEKIIEMYANTLINHLSVVQN
ncbi:MAG: 1-acyl-sn-glycerol-3-phosphate acyltransferase [Dysgonamonadaceae bacterium]|nr:1-acyl-sn-glycerol-3-phosphate acyltransferase [Dysgonamonadaceae bacterium]MDD3355944.1 1-acyl-sn-glycerol-3-phosphate acyltransferase [Dysgonamonadaceae bacterium]MDD3726843.1 1-acyl-sn-glycerol-3-phosphate acyltransferase [Dysgonamonadaceae bacterium]MDD4246291.1 1-acyl-sn-glycerol-3-phosphate acyltransferase [Dysgonamonadaceae bacterium]